LSEVELVLLEMMPTGGAAGATEKEIKSIVCHKISVKKVIMVTIKLVGIITKKVKEGFFWISQNETYYGGLQEVLESLIVNSWKGE